VSARLDACRGSSRLYYSHFATRTVDNTVELYAAKPDTRPESRFLPTPPAFDAPIRGVPVVIAPYRLVRKNSRIMWLPNGKKISDMFIHFGATHERGGQTDGHRMPT